MTLTLRHTAALFVLLLLAACAGKRDRLAQLPPVQQQPVISEPAPPPAVIKPKRAADAVLARAALPALPDAAAALAAFRLSCPVVLRRDDLSGLTLAGDWQAACAAAALTAPDAAAAFFQQQFAAITIAAGSGFATGYYEPEIAASLTRQPGYEVPIYRRPADLIDVPLGDFAASLKGRTVRGRVVGNRLVPYHARIDISGGALAGRGLELAWAADPYEVFFLEIQGSGRLRLTGGDILRIGYDGQNGRDYLAIGRLLIEQGRLQRGKAGMAEILGWLRSHPDDAAAVLNANGSKIFFRLLTGDGPIGALNVPVTPRVSVAADPAFVPLGAPLLVDTVLTRTGEPFVALMVAQDTGGAIKGANRIDLFLGAGPDAAAIAGAQAAPAQLIVLIPASAANRLLP
ncbi:murein transglycosylase A [Sandarakinorhabdus sp.]|uniref:murein transglycosylase A n=1 Tax=Sandarakinorhabdus sp. TaxID=1916663 RepID=UPI00333E8969